MIRRGNFLLALPGAPAEAPLQWVLFGYGSASHFFTGWGKNLNIAT